MHVALAALLALVAATTLRDLRRTIRQALSASSATAPGGMADILARHFGQKFGEKIKQPVIVENKTGAGGVIAADYVAKSPADGYTLYVGFHATNAILPILDPKLPYNPARDFAPIIHVANLPNVLVVNSKVEVKSVKELVELARSKPGALSYASQGIGSSGHIAGEQFRLLTKTDIVHVPYKRRRRPCRTHRRPRADDVRHRAVRAPAHPRRQRARPGCCRAAARPGAAGHPDHDRGRLSGVQGGAWFALFAPAGTHACRHRPLNNAARDAFNAPDVRDKLEPRGVVLVLGSPRNSAPGSRPIPSAGRR